MNLEEAIKKSRTALRGHYHGWMPDMARPIERLNLAVRDYMKAAYPDVPEDAVCAYYDSIARPDTDARPDRERNPTGRHDMHGIALVIESSCASPVDVLTLLKEVSEGKNLIGTHACAIDNGGKAQKLRINNAFVGPISHAFESAAAGLIGPRPATLTR